VAYGSFVVDIKDHKDEKERTRLTVGGDPIEYPGDKSTRTAGLTTAKILINSVISTPSAKFLVIDIKNFYLNTPLGRFEYMVINLASFPQETIKKYGLNELAQDGKVYIEIQKGMYGLPQAGILANELLQRNLTKDGYSPTTHMLIPQVRPAHKYPNSPWETIHPPGGDNAVCMYPHTVYTAECDKSLTATYQCKIPIPSNKILVTNILAKNL
jgi:hypothetical protein